MNDHADIIMFTNNNKNKIGKRMSFTKTKRCFEMWNGRAFLARIDSGTIILVIFYNK